LPRIFISYRRDDSLIHARLLHNELAARCGAAQVFMDVDDIDYGDDFKRVIDAHLDTADVVVAVIGPRWLELLQRRLASDDYVRYELARALERASPDGLRVIPVLVGGAGVPGAAPLRTPDAWHQVMREPTAATRIDVGAHARTGYTYRWTVQARDAAQRSGPASSPLYFSCGPSEPYLR
jgi:hypothetical protein